MTQHVTNQLRARLAARRAHRAFERALAKAEVYGGASDLIALSRRG